jgi:hypothetical protein
MSGKRVLYAGCGARSEENPSVTYRRLSGLRMNRVASGSDDTKWLNDEAARRSDDLRYIFGGEYGTNRIKGIT